MKRSNVLLIMFFLITSIVSTTVLAEEEIVTNLDSMYLPNWSPDGINMTFSSNGDIFVVEIETGEVVCLTDYNDYHCYNSMYSHDGTEIYFSQYALLQGERPESQENKGISTRALQIETGETRLVFDVWTELSDLSQNDRYALYLKDWKYHAVYDFETGEEKVFDLSETTEAPFFRLARSSLTPDNKHFITTYDSFGYVGRREEFNDKFKLYLVDVDTGETEAFHIGDYAYYHPNFSPDGSRLAVTQVDYGSKEVPITEETIIHERHRDGTIESFSPVKRYRTDEGNFWIKDPETGEYVHPDIENFWNVEGNQDAYYIDSAGRYIFFTNSYKKTRTIHETTYKAAIYDIELGEITEIIDSGSFMTYVGNWSPGGRRISYITYDENRSSSLYIYDVEQAVHKLVVRLDEQEEPTVVEKNESVPVTFSLTGNYPNPFNPVTTIEFSLEKAGNVSLSIYNIMGQHVRDLMSGHLHRGTHSQVWDGRDDGDNRVSSGVYICRMKVGEQVTARQMMLMK